MTSVHPLMGDPGHILGTPASATLGQQRGLTSPDAGAAMHAQEHSTLREGVVAGAIGGLIVALWYLLVDTAGGQPFDTPNIALRMGVWLGMVLAFGLFAGLTYMLGTATDERLSPWSVVSGSLLGVLGMAGY